MKINQPVSQVEIPFPHEKYLVSKTDLKGAITYANDAFVEISGFSRAELIGKNHNLVRHPDMPPQAFADLWRTVKEGLPWRGVVKNRAKNGDYYWVDAFVAPIRENDRTTGYMSVRSEPRREQVRQADALYRKLNETKEALDTSPGWMRRLTIRTRLLAVMGFMALMLVGSALVGLNATALSNQALDFSYRNRLEPVDMLWRINALMNENRALVMLGLQHNPANPYAAMLNDEPLTTYTDAIIRNRDEITVLWEEFKKREMAPELQAQAEKYYAARARYVKEGLQPARAALLAGDYDKANAILLKQLNPTYKEAHAEVVILLNAIKQASQQEYAAAVARYLNIRNFSAAGAVVALVLVLAAALLLLRAIVKPMRQAMRHFDRISQGDLTDEINISGRDEAGCVLTSLAIMQVHLKVMLDEITAASRAIDARSGDLLVEMIGVVTQSEMQHDRAQSTAAATEEFSQSAKEVADSADGTARAALNSQVIVSDSRHNMEKSMEATVRVVAAVQASSSTITDLNQAIQKIGDITQVIKEIADQTNLLALNAAIEAARAGESGRGFAVVADEVRKLAERTARSTTDINSMVEEIHNVTQQTVASMDHAVAEVEDGISMMRASGETLNRITASSEEMTDMAQHIAAAAKQQAAASNEVAQNMEQISGLVEDNMALAQQAKLAADGLQNTAAELEEIVSHFQIFAKR
ncbi:MAG: methyl-accepting chemotaxis protein [Sulfuricellaceae bacterium]